MDKWREEVDDTDDFEADVDDQNANIKYEVYDCGEGGLGDGGYQEYQEAGGLTEQLEQQHQQHQQQHQQYHSMTVVPGPVHNMQFPPTGCT